MILQSQAHGGSKSHILGRYQIVPNYEDPATSITETEIHRYIHLLRNEQIEVKLDMEEMEFR